jgi:hypothetical protein
MRISPPSRWRFGFFMPAYGVTPIAMAGSEIGRGY